MTPDQITLQLGEARRHAAQGNLPGALAAYASIMQLDRGNRRAFEMYRQLHTILHGHDITHAEVFDFVYLSNRWIVGSGFGSLPQTTENYRGFLQEFLARHDIRSVIDAGCGDWQFSRLIDWSGIDYLGIDVSAVALADADRFAASNIRFAEGDIRTLDLPGADLLILKDVLQHWPNADIHALLPKLARYRYCLITNGTSRDVEARLNQDIAAGDWRPLDLALPPFGWVGEYVHAYEVDLTIPNGDPIRERKRVFLLHGGQQSP